MRELVKFVCPLTPVVDWERRRGLMPGPKDAVVHSVIDAAPDDQTADQPEILVSALLEDQIA